VTEIKSSRLKAYHVDECVDDRTIESVCTIWKQTLSLTRQQVAKNSVQLIGQTEAYLTLYTAHASL